MKLHRWRMLRILPVGLGVAVYGCQSPDVRPKPPRVLSNHQHELRVDSPQTQQPTAAIKPQKTAASQPAESKIPAGIRPADSLTACRPLTGKKALSLTRFVEDMPPLKSRSETLTQEKPEAQQFRIPESLPGASATPLTIPERNPNEPFEKHREKVQQVYSPLPALPAFPFLPGDGQMISLAELQQIAYANSPKLAAAASRVEQARGKTIQAGLYPNPEAGYQADTVNTAATAGYHGVYASQEIVTANKLQIAQSVACQDIATAELELRRVEIELATAVRQNYFLALISQERLKFSQALAELFQETYKAHIDLVAGGESAGYEPLQLRVFAVQARNDAIQAANDYQAAWRSLAAVLNAPHLQPRELTGSPEMPVPQISYEDALATMLSRHTDLGIAQTKINKSEYNLWLQQVTPIPNVNLAGVLQYDDTTPLNDLSFNLQVGVPLPVFNKNQGNIYEAESQIVENHHNLQSAQNDLTAELADAYARYQTSQILAANYRNDILPDQVRTYRGVYQRFREGADTVDFAEIIVTQQQLGQLVGNYVDVLTAQWQAVVDLGNLLQADDLLSLSQPQLSTEEPAHAPEPILIPTPAIVPQQ